MLSLPTLAAFSGAAIAALLLPGPSVLYIVTRSVQQGRRAGFASMFGVELGGLVHVAAAALGLSAVLASSAVAFTVIKYAGAAYLVFLGVRTLLERGRAALTVTATATATVTGEPRAVPLGRVVGQGVVVNLFNPKTTLFFLAFLPQFVDPAAGAVALQIVLLGLLFTLLALVSDSGYVLLASTVALLLRRSTFFRRTLRYLSGGTYIGLGVATAVTDAPRPSAA